MRDYWMEKKAANASKEEKQLREKLIQDQKKRDEDRVLTSSINALAALGTAGGIGAIGTGAGDKLGGTMAGASILGAGGYHAARMLGAPKTLRVLSALVGATGGGTLGYMVGDDLYRQPEHMKRIADALERMSWNR